MVNITLLSDFGLNSASVASVKGMLLTAIPGARITDISHEVPPFDTAQASYLLQRVSGSFDDNTVHVVLVDIYYTANPKLILCAHNGMYYLGPDNGVLSSFLQPNADNCWLCLEMAAGKSFTDWLHTTSNIIKQLQSASPSDMGLVRHSPSVTPANNTPQNGNTIVCNVIYIDHFGNVVTDMQSTTFRALNRNGRFTLRFMMVNEITTLSNSYTDVRQGENMCRFNRSGYLEICVNKGSAAGLFGFRLNSKHNDIKITFE